YTTYLDPEEVEKFYDNLSGNIGGGIGAEIGIKDDRVSIIRTLEGTPARKAGLMAGDAFISVNGADASDWTVEQTVDTIRGDVGTTVKITVLRGNEQKEVTVTRAEISTPSVESEVDDGIGTLTISRFDEETGRLARSAAEDFKR
ncbi:peptidase S41, partial [Aliarcobacter cryaerophilus]